ncbi:sensor histidine kinase [Epilithonimonas sp. JDS]|uniref:sensor histidine kinase n=1 Tax=Epilithonimonas sp. JDS TaxID=2902797 RepID=UPI001E324DFD|nr:histidine kinase [Epilithonimonas sp. JDS]MCD9855281.1 sensor histidine kinase [Epilithonimonas sp. JDS]
MPFNTSKMQENPFPKEQLSNQNFLQDFERFYNRSPKIIFHFLMWFFFSALLFVYYRFDSKITFFECFLMTFRAFVSNAVIFYGFFYLIFPKIKKFRINYFLIVISILIPISIYVWLIVNNSMFRLYHYFGWEIKTGRFAGMIKVFANQSIKEVIGLEVVLSNIMLVIYILLPFFFVKILFEIVRIYNKTTQLQQQKLEVEIQNINIEKDFLKSQLNPHFLFNTLNNLYGLSVKKDDSAPEVILNLSEIMSYTLYESNSEKVSLEKELDFIRNYFELEKMRYPKDKNIQLEILDDDQIAGLYIAPLLTFTFIENAFKYGLKNSDKQFINQKIKIENDTFYFVLKNDFDKTEIKKEFGGIGLENIKKRLHLLYPNQHDLKISTFENSFKVELKINL